MRQTQFSLAAEPTQQRILALAIAMKPFGKNALKLNGSVTVAVPRRLHVTYYEASMGIYMGKVGETVKHPATWVKIAKANLQATGCAGGSSYCSRDQRVSVRAIRSKARTREAAARRRSPPPLRHSPRLAIAALSHAGHRTNA
jgi:hypothetical protein